MNKRIILIIWAIIQVIVLLSCTGTETKKDEISFSSGTFWDKDWTSPVGTYRGDVVPDEKSAVEIATAIYNNMEKANKNDKRVPQTCFYDEPDEIWIVGFWEEQEQTYTGGDCSIALRKKDGKVMRIWFGE